jgi:hypothetical protein
MGRPLDAQCNAPTRYFHLYKDAQTGTLERYDPASPPPGDRVATTTTDRGVSAPFVVRVEEGTIDRAIYQIAVLADPGKPFTALAPQPTWNGKVLFHFGGSSAFHHVQRAPAPPETGRGTYNAFDGIGEVSALGRGFVVATTGLSSGDRTHDEVLTTEAIYMLKQRIASRYGPIRYTIGAGCSGGSIQQNLGASKYPGILDGIQPSCTFSDSLTVLRMVADCHLLLHYFSRTSPALWGSPDQQAAVTGYQDASGCHAWEALFANLMDPASRGCFTPGTAPPCTASATNQCALPQETIYEPEGNPRGIRCAVWDYMRNVWGPRPPEVWTAPERRIGRGFARRPFDNVGVQYGLEALRAGRITPGQFADLNAKLGGIDIDWNVVPRRMVADPGAVATAYRTGELLEARHLDTIPILDLRNQGETAEVHHTYHSSVYRARLQAANGDHDNHAMWTYLAQQSAPLPVPGPDLRERSLEVMDRWVAAIEADTRPGSQAAKVRRNRPPEATDKCWAAGTLHAPGAQEIDPSACAVVQPHGEPRLVAGEPRTLDVLKCRLEPLRRADYPVVFTDAEWAQLEAAFPDGVCDYGRAPVDRERGVPWLSYQDANGDVVYGGRPIGAAPRSEVASQVGLPTARRCASRRRFRIRLRAPRGQRLASARVYVNGRRRAVRRGRRLTAPVDLRGLPRGTVRVTVVARTRSGRRVVERRRYRTCVPKRRRA